MLSVEKHFLSRPYLERVEKKFNPTFSFDLLTQFEQSILKKEVLTNTIQNETEVTSLCILSFNYTSMADQYIARMNINSKKIISIHGRLVGDDIWTQRPVFGFGDELDENYLKFEDLDNDELFEHIKSFKYLQSTSYRSLLEFIEAMPFQVQIFGHSCGLSDRTLLNTIFEHENCISVKPFYYEWEGGDDYEQKSFAISRHFKSKAELRAKVVNKQYCEAMAQPVIKSTS